ncbi:hypothetical protein LCGC14_1517330, partial [marine sediment metagenome]
MAIVAYALTTVARQKSFMGISSAANDTLIETLIGVVTDFIENFCDRRFKQTVYSNEVYDGNGANKLLLRQFPVISGEAFTLQQRDSISNNSNFSSIDSELYFVKNRSGIVVLAGSGGFNRGAGGIFIRAPQHYRISYTAGYAFDNAGEDTLVAVGLSDLEFAVWKLVSTIFNERKQNTGVRSEKIGDYSVTLQKTALTDQQVEQILYKYRRPYG